MANFWQNTIWYILLGLTSAVSLFMIFIKSRSRKTAFAFWAAVLGLTYALEVVLMFGLKAYTYQPLIAQDKIQDSIIGNFFSQFSVSSSAVLICVYGLPFYWRIGFSIAYYLIDLYFTHIGIYTHNWYLSIFTLAGFFMYSLLISKWYALLLENKSQQLLTNASLFLAAFATGGNSIITTLNLAGIQMFILPVSNQIVSNHLYGSLLYGPALVLIFIILRRVKARPCWKVLVLPILFCVQYWLYAIGFMKVKEGWFIIAALLDILGYCAWVAVLDRLFIPVSKKRNSSLGHRLHSGCFPPL